MKEFTQARNCFTALGANKNMEDFFERIENHCVALKANPDQRLMVLRSSIPRDDIRPNTDFSITRCRSSEDLKKTCFRDFGKPLPYWKKENWGHKLVDKYLQTWAMQYSNVVSCQTINLLDRESKTCPPQFWIQKRLMFELPVSVSHEALAMWNAKEGGTLYGAVEIAQKGLDKFYKLPLNYNHPPPPQTNTHIQNVTITLGPLGQSNTAICASQPTWPLQHVPKNRQSSLLEQ
jgi:hypothetical protein